MELLTFDAAIQDSLSIGKRNLLLGNGFSIACKPNIFRYGALYDQADFSAAPEIKAAFESLQTQDFEVVIRALENAAKLLSVYSKDNGTIEKLNAHASLIKELLVSTIAGNHPPNPNDINHDSFWRCRKFLAHFLNQENDGRVYTLNYDLLLYWALMHDDNPFDDEAQQFVTNDGFGEDEDTEVADYVIWKGESGANKQKVFYLHGALHLFDGGAELKKYTWNRKGIPLIDQIREAISNNLYPLFVSEGTSQQKLTRIRHHAYLQHAYKSFHSITEQQKQSLFVYGHSLADNDSHILKKIGRGKLPRLYIGLYGDPNSDANKFIKRKSAELVEMRNPRYPLEVKFYNAETANIWS